MIEDSIQEFKNFTNSINYYIYFIASITIVPIGTILNIIAILIFIRKRFNKTNFGFMNIILILFDTFSLIWSFVIYKYLPAIDHDLGFKSEFLCFTYQYFSRLVQQLPGFIQVFISTYQYFEINLRGNKLWFNTFKKRGNILAGIFFMNFIICLINVPNFFKYLRISRFYNNETRSEMLRIRCSHDLKLSFISSVITALMRSLIPVGLLIYLNILIARTLFNSRRKFIKTTENSKREMNFTFGLFISNIIFFVFNSPLSVSYVLVIVIQNFHDLDSYIVSTALLIHACCNAFAFSYNSLSFFLNIMLNKAFRAEFYICFGKILEKIGCSRWFKRDSLDSLKVNSNDGTMRTISTRSF